MNVHHLELFYFVARHGGIMPAVRNIPYGIQQPAVSAQVAQLEEFLGATLFQRRPFALTPAGEKLYDFISPFFSKLDAVAVQWSISQFRSGRLGEKLTAECRLLHGGRRLMVVDLVVTGDEGRVIAKGQATAVPVGEAAPPQARC